MVLTRVVACALVVMAVGCGGGADRAAVGAPRPTTTPTDSRPGSVVPADALLGIVSPWNGDATLLAPVSRRSLKPGAPRAVLGEYHSAWSMSPDRRLAAFGISAPGENARIGIRVVDLGTLRAVKDIETGIAAEAVGWIAPDRVAAYLLSGEVVVVDPRSGEEIAREGLGATSCPFAPPHAVTPLGLVMVAAVADSARVVLVEPTGRVQTLRLDDIFLGEAFGLCQSAGLAVDPARLVAYVVGADAPLAEVDLRTMKARRHRVTGAPVLTRSGCQACGSQRSAVWLGRGRLAVAGTRHRSTRANRIRETPVGVAVVDTRDWAARVIARRAGAARLAGDRLLVYDGRHPAALAPRTGAGLRVYDRSGRLRFAVLDGERVGDVQVAGARAYARTRRGLHVVDLRRGVVIARSPGGGRRDVDLLAPR